MEKSDIELGMLYESFVIKRGLVSALGKKIKEGFGKGKKLAEIIADNWPDFLAVFNGMSLLGTIAVSNRIYQDNPEILQQHTEYAQAAIRRVAQFLSDHPEILKIFLANG